MSNEKALMQIRVAPDVKARVLDAVGGPRKISAWVEAVIRAALDGSPATVEAPREEAKSEASGYVLDPELEARVQERAAFRKVEPRVIVERALTTMFDQYPLEPKKVEQSPDECDHKFGDPFKSTNGWWKQCKKCRGVVRHRQMD